MLITDIKRIVDQLSREKGIDAEVLIATIKDAVESAAKKKFGSSADIEIHYDKPSGQIEVFHFKEVVETIEFPDKELSLEQGYEYDPDCEIGDSLGIRIDAGEFGRIAAQTAKQVIIQKFREAERNAVYENFIHKKGQIINGIVHRFDRGSIIVNLGQTEAVMRPRDQMPNETYKRGDRIRAYVVDVLEESKGAQIILSRSHPDFLIELFKTEVPEVAEGIVTILEAARYPGVRAKIAVQSSDSDVDPVGACVGMKGSRIQNIVQELRGEKIDVVPWNPDIAKFVCNSLAPAEITRVVIDEDNQSMEVIVPEDHLSISIGKNGQNISLACELTGWHLQVMSEEEYSRGIKQGYDDLMRLSGINIATAEILLSAGFSSLADIAEALVDDICSLVDFDEKQVVEIIAEAKQLLAVGNKKEEKESQEEIIPEPDSEQDSKEDTKPDTKATTDSAETEEE
ncbi:MAG: transcription termination factor NusA [Desulfobacterales bacterium]|nr:transcription termination factor NusA [Desulfobacterales bacterium]